MIWGSGGEVKNDALAFIHKAGATGRSTGKARRWLRGARLLRQRKRYARSWRGEEGEDWVMGQRWLRSKSRGPLVIGAMARSGQRGCPRALFVSGRQARVRGAHMGHAIQVGWAEAVPAQQQVRSFSLFLFFILISMFFCN
jgi:hypothetical protein